MIYSILSLITVHISIIIFNRTLQEKHGFATNFSTANPFQTHENPLQICFSNEFATKELCCQKPWCNSITIDKSVAKK